MSASAPVDPRMAMARERAATVRVDQATAVFTTRALRDGDGADGVAVADGGPAGSAGVGSDGSSGSGRSGEAGPGSEGAEGGVPEDGRLRAAVAAWVATADEDAEVPDPAGGGSSASDTSASDTSASDTAVLGATSDAAGERESAALPEAGAATDDADRAASAVDAATESAAESESESGSGSGSASAVDAVTEGAPGSATADGPQAAADAERAPSGASGGDKAADVGPAVHGSAVHGPAVRGPATNDGDSTSAQPEAHAERSSAASAAGSAEGSGTVGEAGPGAGAGPAGGEPADAEPEADVSSSAEAPETLSASGRDASAEPASEADAQPSAAEDASARDADADPKAPVRTSDEAPGGAADDEAGDDTGDNAVSSPNGSPKAPSEDPRVDQPTAVFKAPRLPAVDQPTTMLKLGDTKRPTDKPKPRPEPSDKPTPEPTDKPTPEPTDRRGPAPTDRANPEAPAERTSKFVALKPLDSPAPVWPKPAPGAPGGTAALPQVGPGRPQAGPERPQAGPDRTTQQPLPPKPPLDLLAELTNTPPPAQTPVRTIVRRVKIWTPLVLLLAVVFAVVQAVRPLPATALTLTADATYTFEGGTLDLPWPGQGQSAIEVEGVGSLGTDGKQTAAPIASVAKIMTAYVILQDHPLKGNEGGEKITVDQQAEDESKNVDESTAAMTKGQQFTERQMLQLLMIPSGNNAARLLARWDSDSKAFVGKMNDAAKKLGMTNTTYTDPSGLEKTTVSTATDQLKLAKEVMQNPVFADIVGMASATIPGLDGTIYNNNDLLVKQVGVTGLKTGSSTPAGGNLVWAATKTVNGKTQTVYGAVLGQNAGTGKVWDSLQLALTNSQKLIDKVQQSLTSATVVKKGDVVGYVDDQLGGQTPVVATKDMTAVGWPGLKTKLAIGTAGGDTVPHSGKAGTVVGELTVGDGSDHAVAIPVALQSDLAEPGFGAKLTRVG
ncbi:serine hydrolase [Streptomyces sp. NPDC005808]|uniref:D-alanyl-D-alanine carboxypeptidase n=1 Tax=Streptomyces sp. NPDC005808 TaxID=3364734 RepID=UPI00367AE87B